ncbi:Unconventional myosin-XVIIIa, partial [Aptenodytes forsteri]
MFNLMKKDKEKDGARKEKKEKKEKKERMSAAELKSLEEMSMRRGFFNLNRASKRDSKTRLEISNPIPIKVASGSDLHLTDIDSDSNRGSVILDSGHLSTASSSDDLKVDDANFKGSVLQRAAKFGSLAKQNSQMIVKRFSFSQKSRDESTSETSTPSEHSAAPSPQVEVRTLETQLAKQGVPPGHPCTPPTASLRARVPELVSKRFPAELRLPALVPPQPPTPRQLELQRRNTGDFGFSLRRTTMLDRAPDGQVYRRVVHFAEPGAGSKDLALGLVPGDRLVEINGRNVENKSRDEIVEMIRQSGEMVQLKVQPILELSELSRCWLRGGQGTRRAAWDVSNAVPAAGPVPWVSAGRECPRGGCLGWQGPWEPAGAGAAPARSDARRGAGDCGWDAGTMPARAPGQQRGCKGAFASGLVNRQQGVGARVPPVWGCTARAEAAVARGAGRAHSGSAQWSPAPGLWRHGLMANVLPGSVCPQHRAGPATPLAAAVAVVPGVLAGEDTSPHIYAVAQAAYRSMLMSRQDQAVVLLGASGSGKTTNCQHLVQYLTTVAGSTGKVFSAPPQAPPAAQLCSQHFSSQASCSRLCSQPDVHRSDQLPVLADSCCSPQPEEKQKATQQFNKLQAAMKVMGISGDEQKAFWLVLGAIYHLGAAGATKDADEAGRKQFARHEWAQKAAYLLGCSLEELSSSIFKHQPKGTLQRSTSFRQGPDEPPLGDGGTGPKLTALECLEGMAAGLYSELFTLLISLLNRALKSSQHSVCSVTVVDTPGAQNPELAGQSRGATFEELCHNYTQERLQLLFHQRTFARELERYKEENIELALADAEPGSSGSVAAVDQPSHQALVRSLARTDEARGLLWLLEEEALQPGGNEDTLLERLFSYYGPQEGGKKGHNPLLPSDKPRHFLLGHSSGTNWVEYDATGWLNHVKHNPATQNASVLLQESQKSGSVAGLEGGSQLALRRATSMRKTFTTGVAAVKKKSLCIQIKLQVDALIDSIKKSKLHFVHCFLPKAAGGGGDPQALPCQRVSGSELELPAEHCEAGLMQLDVPLLRAQLRGSRLLDALRMYRQGYPDHMVFAEFRRRFDVLAPHLTKKHGRNYIVVDEKRAVEELLESLDLEKSSYHMGLSRVFFRAGSLARLEEQRDAQTSRNITLFQAACRGFLARQQFKKRKIQDLAIRCVQKNIKKNKGVKGWPWWKLFTTVRPLIEVQLTEDQIRGKDVEIQQLKSKLEKVEKERNELRLNSDRLESRITELTSELTDERNTGESASQLLDAETAERLRAEKEMKDLQAKYDALKKQMESMEMEVMEARLIRAAELNGELDDDDSGGEWRLKYERAVREIDFTKKRLQQELEDKLEVEQQGKRQLERRLTDLQADSEESQRALQQLKKKCQRLAAELQDTKLHLEGQQGRNHDLEKKQRRFDSELSQAHEEAQRERLQREKLSREKDVLVAEVFGLKQLLEDKDSDIAGLTQKAEALETELQDISSQESKDEASLAKVKKQLRDLEAKVKDQEEELDEQAGTIQMLEQAKLRLEMEMERLRQTHAKEVESRDEEVEEIRQSCQKKLKQMEVQLEEEYEDKQKVLREKRELESKLSAVSEQANQRDFETEKRLRRDLKRTKALLADAQIMLDHLKNNAPSKREIAQLKNQLEESEFTCAAAVKARKSMEVEIEDLHLQIDDLAKAKAALEEQLSRLQREKNEVQSRLEEDQEDMNELMKKHKAAVAQASRDLAQMNDLQAQLEEVSKEKQELQEKLQGLQSQLEFLEQSMVDKSLVSRQEAKIRELETRLEFERTQVKRLELASTRLKENMEKLTEERDQRAAAENREKEQNKRLQRQLPDVKEEMGELAKKEAEASRKKHELEMDLESLEAANQSLQSDLKLAFKRIGDLQAAIEDEMESDSNEDLINSLQDMVAKYQKRKSKLDGDSDVDSELEERVDGVKSWLSKNKGSSKALSDDGSLKGS